MPTAARLTATTSMRRTQYCRPWARFHSGVTAAETMLATASVAVGLTGVAAQATRGARENSGLSTTGESFTSTSAATMQRRSPAASHSQVCSRGLWVTKTASIVDAGRLNLTRARCSGRQVRAVGSGAVGLV